MEERERNSNQANQDSSQRLYFSTPLTSTAQTQTLDHHHHHHHHNISNDSQNHELDLQKEREVPRRDTNQESGEASMPVRPTPSPLRASTSGNDSAGVIRYRECLKNHAASMGAHVVDGCGEFMPGGAEGTAEALKCAACECHRNFHRREEDGEQLQNQILTRNNFSQRTLMQQPAHRPLAVPQPHQNKYQFTGAPGGAPVMMAFGGGTSRGPAESSSDDLNAFRSNAGTQQSKKRFRTKFTKEQKDTMSAFAEKLGWKIQKQDEEEVEQFCDQVGVKRQVFKVWMHNNKQAMRKKPL